MGLKLPSVASDAPTQLSDQQLQQIWGEEQRFLLQAPPRESGGSPSAEPQSEWDDARNRSCLHTSEGTAGWGPEGRSGLVWG